MNKIEQAREVVARLRDEYKCEWVHLQEFGGSYLAGEKGLVYSIPRARTSGGILTPSTDTGYLRVFLCDGNGVRRYYLLHRIILLAFKGPPPAGMEVRHLDGNPMNNNLSNLAYGTKLENAADRVTHGTLAKGERLAKKLDWGSVLDIRALRTSKTQKELADFYGVAKSTIQRIQNGTCWATQY